MAKKDTAKTSDETSSEEIVKHVLAAQRQAVIEVADQGLATIASLVKSEAIDVSPKFQRRDRWEPEQQSALIESFLVHIPVPPVYLAEDEANLGSYAVIDGKQRLTSISTFFEDKLVLRGLRRLEAINGLRYSDLPDGIRIPLGMKSLRVTTLLRQSNEELKHEVFLRLNTGGEILNPQEIRNVAYRGPLNDLVYALGENAFLRKQFKVVPPRSPAYKQMTDAEFALRFITLSEHWEEFRGDLRYEMDSFMSQNRFADPTQLKQWQRRFGRCIETVEAIWSDEAFKRPDRNQALAGLFDAQMLSLASFSQKAHVAFIRNAAKIRRATIRVFQDDPQFDEAVRRATNTPARLRYRTKKMIDLLGKAVKGK